MCAGSLWASKGAARNGIPLIIFKPAGQRATEGSADVLREMLPFALHDVNRALGWRQVHPLNIFQKPTRMR